tara:strand:- start:4350 stop:4868 length:519 start_codon:yes stop_codon:yes gene_type:complete
MANLSVSISENINLNGSNRGSTNTTSISNITQVSNEIKSCPGGVEAGVETFLGNYASIVNASPYSNYNYKDAKYVRVTNLSTEYTIEVAFVSTGVDNICEGKTNEPDSYRVFLEPGQSSILWNASRGKLGASSVPDWARNLTNLSYVSVFNRTDLNIDIEFMVASSTPTSED